VEVLVGIIILAVLLF